MPSSSNVIKGKQPGQKVIYSGLNLPEFMKPASAPGVTGFSPSTSTGFTSNLTGLAGELANLIGEPAALPIRHSAVLHGNQVKLLVNGWSIPVLQGNTLQRGKANTASGSEDSSRLLAQAKVKSAEIIAETNVKTAQMLTEAKKEAEGLRQKAFMEGMSAAKSEAAQSMHQMERVFQETQLWQEQVMHQSQGRIIEMIVEIGRKLFGDGFQLPAEQLDHIVSRAINEASRLGNLQIYLHPDDAKILVNLWQESEITVNGQQIQIVSSQNISRGGCFVDGQFGIVDGRVEEQIDQIAESLKPVVSNLEAEES
ncbi:MAG: FliH/SctL family protein [Leptolinea sp.]